MTPITNEALADAPACADACPADVLLMLPEPPSCHDAVVIPVKYFADEDGILTGPSSDHTNMQPGAFPMHHAAPDTPAHHPFRTFELYRVLRLFVGPAQAYRMTFGARASA